MHGGSRRFFLWLSILALLIGGVGYAWAFTPSYTLYRIRQALLAHDYATFSYYVDVDSVIDHTFSEIIGANPASADERQEAEHNPKPRGALAKLFRKGILKKFARDAREVMKAGVEIALEQAIRDQERPLPEIPPAAVAAALWIGKTEGDSMVFPVRMKKKQQLDIRVRKNPAGVWRVVEISNLSALLPALRRFQEKQEQQARE